MFASRLGPAVELCMDSRAAAGNCYPQFSWLAERPLCRSKLLRPEHCRITAFAVAPYRRALATLMPWELPAQLAMPLYSASATCSR